MKFFRSSYCTFPNAMFHFSFTRLIVIWTWIHDCISFHINLINSTISVPMFFYNIVLDNPICIGHSEISAARSEIIKRRKNVARKSTTHIFIHSYEQIILLFTGNFNQFVFSLFRLYSFRIKPCRRWLETTAKGQSHIKCVLFASNEIAQPTF